MQTHATCMFDLTGFQVKFCKEVGMSLRMLVSEHVKNYFLHPSVVKTTEKNFELC